MSLRKHIARLIPASSAARGFLALALVLGGLYAVVNPPFAVNDERDHWLRVLEITKGRVRTRSDEQGTFYQAPRDYHQLILRYAHAPREHEPRVSVTQLAQDLTTPAEKPPHWTRRNATASVYPPIPYLPQIPAVGLARLLKLPPLWQLYFARASSVVCYALIAAWAVALAGELGWVFFVLGLMPMSLTQAAGLSGDGVGQAVSFLYFALIARGTFTAEPLSRRQLGWLLALAALLPLCKPPHLLFVGATLALRWDGPRPHWRRWLYFLGASAIALGAFAFWSHLNRGVDTPADSRVGNQLRSLTDHPANLPLIALHTLLSHVDDYLIQFVAIRDVLHRQVRFAGGLLVGLYLPLLAAVTLGASRRALRLRPGLRAASLWLVLAGLSSAGAVLFAMYLFATEPGTTVISGAQGRYFIPLAPALLLPLSTVGNPALGRYLTQHSGHRLRFLLVGLNLLTLAVLIARYYGTSDIDWPY